MHVVYNIYSPVTTVFMLLALSIGVIEQWHQLVGSILVRSPVLLVKLWHLWRQSVQSQVHGPRYLLTTPIQHQHHVPCVHSVVYTNRKTWCRHDRRSRAKMDQALPPLFRVGSKVIRIIIAWRRERLGTRLSVTPGPMPQALPLAL